MNLIKDILGKQFVNSITDNSNNKYIHTVNSIDKSIDTVNSKTAIEQIEEILQSENITTEGAAHLLAEGLDDTESLSYYMLLTKEHNNSRLLKAMHLTKEAGQMGKIRSKKAIYFQAILRNWGFKTKFRETNK